MMATKPKKTKTQDFYDRIAEVHNLALRGKRLSKLRCKISSST